MIWIIRSTDCDDTHAINTSIKVLLKTDNSNQYSTSQVDQCLTMLIMYLNTPLKDASNNLTNHWLKRNRKLRLSHIF